MLNLFTPDHRTVAQRELKESRLRLLEAQSALEYAQAMVAYHTQRIQRLEEMPGVVREIPREHEKRPPTPNSISFA
jgi:hypothetical protein